MRFGHIKMRYISQKFRSGNPEWAFVRDNGAGVAILNERSTESSSKLATLNSDLCERWECDLGWCNHGTDSCHLMKARFQIEEYLVLACPSCCCCCVCVRLKWTFKPLVNFLWWPGTFDGLFLLRFKNVTQQHINVCKNAQKSGSNKIVYSSLVNTQ